MSKVSLSLTIALIVIAGIIGIGIGYALTPQYSLWILDGQTNGSTSGMSMR